MKISALYFLDYPDRLPDDPRVAASEARVEVGEGNPTIKAFDHTFSFQVYTMGFLEKEFRENKRQYLIARATIVVPIFDPELIRSAITSILDRIQDYGLDAD